MSTSPTSGSHDSLPLGAPPKLGSNTELSLETLVTHLLASKRSLSSISAVWRANELVSSARSVLEESSVLSARTDFTRAEISEQAKLLRRVRGGIEEVYKYGQQDFKRVVKTLDAANERLELTMEELRSTVVEASFRPVGEAARSLLDFVDTQEVETMRDILKGSIRESNDVRTKFDTSILRFDDDLRALKAAMTFENDTHNTLTASSPIPPSLQALESNAQELASLLDSLVSHFDLCVNAIRHTEGGFAAVRKAASSLPPGADHVSVSGVMAAESQESSEDRLSEEERTEMLQVLENDAEQVDDVVAEIRDRLGEMESEHAGTLEHVSMLTTQYNITIEAFNILETIGARLPSYVLSSADFRLQWEDTKQQIQEQLENLDGLRVFFEEYHASYDALILEVHRRRRSEDKVKTILSRAMEQVQEESAVDAAERITFEGDFGGHIPLDLWSGVKARVPRWEIVPAFDGEGGQNDDLGKDKEDAPGDNNPTPNIERSVVEAAKQRQKRREGRGGCENASVLSSHNLRDVGNLVNNL